MTAKRVLMVDDDPQNLEFLSMLLEREGWAFDAAENGRAAIAKLESGPFDLVISDLMMPGMNGIELLDAVKERWPATEVVIVTAHGSIPTAIEAIKKGAYSYLLRPFEPDEVALMIKKIFEIQGVRQENLALKEELARLAGPVTIVTRSPRMRRIFEIIESVAPSNATALVTGESGVGKELIARAIHRQSQRAEGPFIKVSCAALPEQLLESELFGHERGSFTGAVAQRKGRFELADKGTLFLDEIGEISPAVQVKLLRAIQEREFERVGGTQTLRTDTRIVAATNKSLAEEVKKGTFREDLYYRLNVIALEIPPLRDRKEDIAPLVYHFIEKYRREVNKEVTAASAEALVALSAYNWPGNIRELQNVIERAVVLTRDKEIGLDDLPDTIRPARTVVPVPSPTAPADDAALVPLREAKAAWEKSYLERALMRHRGNISRTAETIELARKNLQEKIKQYGIDTAALSGGE